MKVGIFGFGAVGSAIYNELEGYNDLYVLADKKRIERYRNTEFQINGRKIHPKYLSNGKMDVIFVCLKNYQLEAALPNLGVFLAKNTIIIPMMNGIAAHDDIKKKYPFARVLYGVINVESNKKDSDTICGKILNLQFGEEYNLPVKRDVLEIRKLLLKYNIHNHIYMDMKRRVWLKWMLNMGINQISALMNATYKDMRHEKINALFPKIFEEVYQVGKAYGIALEKTDIDDQMTYCNRFSSDRVTSMTIDFNEGRENELEAFSGTLLSLARKKNIPVPINETLYALLSLKQVKQ